MRRAFKLQVYDDGQSQPERLVECFCCMQKRPVSFSELGTGPKIQLGFQLS